MYIYIQLANWLFHIPTENKTQMNMKNKIRNLSVVYSMLGSLKLEVEEILEWHASKYYKTACSWAFIYLFFAFFILVRVNAITNMSAWWMPFLFLLKTKHFLLFCTEKDQCFSLDFPSNAFKVASFFFLYIVHASVPRNFSMLATYIDSQGIIFWWTRNLISGGKKEKKSDCLFLEPKVEKQLYFMIRLETTIVFLSHSHLINSLKGTSPFGQNWTA